LFRIGTPLAIDVERMDRSGSTFAKYRQSDKNSTLFKQRWTRNTCLRITRFPANPAIGGDILR